MDISKTIKSLESNGYAVSFFKTSKEAVKYLEDTVENKKIGFGGSRTLTQLDLQNLLSKKNIVLNPDYPEDGETFMSTALKSLDFDYYFLSANGLTEDGIIVLLDMIGNRIGGSLFGHKKVYYVVGTNKITKNLDDAIWRVRNIAAPQNARSMNLKTPCAIKGDKCYNCKSPDRICNCLMIYLKKTAGCEVEIVLIDEALGL